VGAGAGEHHTPPPHQPRLTLPDVLDACWTDDDHRDRVRLPPLGPDQGHERLPKSHVCGQECSTSEPVNSPDASLLIRQESHSKTQLVAQELPQGSASLVSALHQVPDLPGTLLQQLYHAASVLTERFDQRPEGRGFAGFLQQSLTVHRIVAVPPGGECGQPLPNQPGGPGSKGLPRPGLPSPSCLQKP